MVSEPDRITGALAIAFGLQFLVAGVTYQIMWYATDYWPAWWIRQVFYLATLAGVWLIMLGFDRWRPRRRCGCRHG